MRQSTFGLAVLLTLTLAACGDDAVGSDPSTDDAGLPCPTDDGGEPMARVDTGVPNEDSGVDSGVDSGIDSGTDSGPLDEDAGSIDAGPELFIPTPVEDLILATLSPLPDVAANPTNAFADNAAAAALGQAFFFDERFSGALVVASDLGGVGDTGKIACVSCHNGPWMDDQRTALPRKVSLGANFHTRNAPAAVNSVLYRWTNWGGRFSAPWELPIAVVESGVIMNGSRLQVAQVIFDNYKTAYEAVFGTLDPVIDTLPATGKPKAAGAPDGAWETMLDDPQRALVNAVLVNFGKAIEAYERLLTSGNAPFDQYVEGDDDALSEDAKQGFRIFAGKARCVSCHNGPMFTDDQFHNIGVPQPAGVIDALKIDTGRFKDMPGLYTSPFSTAISGVSDDINTGRLVGVTNPPPAELKGRFRTPGLRGVAETAPYTHAGEFATLEELVNFYDQGGAPPITGTLDPLMLPLLLTAQEKQQLVAFLESLSGDPIPAPLRVDSTP